MGALGVHCYEAWKLKFGVSVSEEVDASDLEVDSESDEQLEASEPCKMVYCVRRASYAYFHAPFLKRAAGYFVSPLNHCVGVGCPHGP